MNARTKQKNTNNTDLLLFLDSGGNVRTLAIILGFLFGPKSFVICVDSDFLRLSRLPSPTPCICYNDILGL